MCVYFNYCMLCSYSKDLSSKYTKIRQIRGDGNCFFRAFGFAYLEYLLKNRTEVEK